MPTMQSHMLPEVEVGDEAMVEYTMYMPNNMPPRDFILRLQLFTFQNGQYSSIIVFNEVGSWELMM
jgi:hypothetical protein